MPQTGPDNIHEQVTHRARGYRKNMIWLIVASDQVDTSYKRPGGGLVSTAPDMARFAVAILNQKLVNSETLAAMWTNQKLSNGKESPWGLGWQVMTGTESGVHWALHAGQQPEVSSLLMVATEQGYSVVLMSNLERIASTSLLAIAKEINKIVLKGN